VAVKVPVVDVSVQDELLPHFKEHLRIDKVATTRHPVYVSYVYETLVLSTDKPSTITVLKDC